MKMKEQKTIAMQVDAVSFADEGTEQVLDNLRQLGGVNTLFLANLEACGKALRDLKPKGIIQ